MFGWFKKLGAAGKVAVVTVALATGTAAGATGVILSNDTSPAPGQSTVPSASACLPDLAYTTRTAEQSRDGYVSGSGLRATYCNSAR